MLGAPYHRSLGLVALPDDVLLEIFSFLEVSGVLSLSQVSRKFYTLSKCFSVWQNLFLNLLHRARYIDLLAIDQKPLEDVSIRELRNSVTVAASAEKNWLSKTPKERSPRRTIDFKDAIRTDISLEQSSYITKFTSRHLLLPMQDGSIVGWNLKENMLAGSIQMDPDSIMVDLALDKSSRTLYGLIGKVAPVRHQDSFGMHVRLSVLRIGVPGTDSTEPLLFERCKQLTLLLPFTSEVHLLDASRRMLCAAFSCTMSKQMAILVVFDWDSEDAAIINTGLLYDYGRSLIGIRLSEDGEYLIVVSEYEGTEVRRWYRLADYEPSPSVWNALEYEPQKVAAPSKEQIFRWKNEHDVLSKTEGTNPYLFWAIDQLPQPPYPEIPTRVSTIVLYITVPEAGLDSTIGEKTWRVTQYYSDKNGPCASSRSLITLRNPVLSPFDPDDEHGLPIICMSFNHFGWVEKVNTEGGEKKRVLKLVTFPDPGTDYDGDLSDRASILDIPSEILDETYHLLLDATQGLVIVATVSQVLHVFRY